MRTAKLYKFSLIFPESEGERILKKLYEWGWTHIEEIKEFSYLFDKKPEKEELILAAENLSKILAAKNLIEDLITRYKIKIKKEERVGELKEIEDKIKEIEEIRKKLDEIEVKESIIRRVKILLKKKKGKKISFVPKKLETIEDLKELEEKLKEGIPELKEEIKKKIEELEEKVEKEKEDVLKVLEGKIKEIYPKVLYLFKYFRNLYNFYSAYEKIGKKGRILCLEGYVPIKKFEEMKNILKNEPVILLYKEIKEGPTLLLQPRFIKPFEFYVRLYGLPKYGHLDPTYVFFIFLPCFLGMCLGDVGYALLLLSLSLLGFFLVKSRVWRDIFYSLILSGLWGIFWGIMFGSFFSGMVPIKSLLAELLGIEYKGLFPLTKEGVMVIMGIGLLAGLIHSNLALVFKILNEKKLKVFLEDVFPFF